jgi:DNA-binding NarL/FixJ family response regulator
MPDTIRVFMADDYDVVLVGLKGILSQHPDIEIVGTHTSGIELTDRIVKAKPDVILLDVKMPHFNIFEAFEALKSTAERDGNFGGELPNVVLVTSQLDPYLARKAYDEGIAGYLLKEDALSENLPSTIRTVAAGGWAYSEAVQQVLNNPNGARGQLTFGGDQFVVLCLMVDGYTNTEIAQITGRTLDALYTMQHRIRLKLCVETNAAAVTKAIQEKIVPAGQSKKLPNVAPVDEQIQATE